MKNTLKNIADGIIMGIVLCGSSIIFVGTITTAMFPIAILSLPVMIVSADRLKSDIDGNYINNSIFSVSRKGKINQDSLRNPISFFKILSKKDKYRALVNEEFKMFKQLKRNDKKGNIITYHTLSQSMTVKLLKDLQKEGFIENLSYEKGKKSKLFLERLLIGNNKKSKNKYQMYNINFNITGIPIDNSVIENYLNPIAKVKIDNNSNNGNISKLENNKILNNNENKIESEQSKSEQIEELKRLRETLIENENRNDLNHKL